MTSGDSVENYPKLRMGIEVNGSLSRPSPLAADEIQVWLADLRQPMERLAELTATLSAEEQERAARFRFAELRDSFIAGRGLLRELLAIYLDKPAATLQFQQGPQGKPILAQEGGKGELHFNLSHSADWALYAVAHRELGVDLECMDRIINPTAIAERICTPREWTAFQAIPTEQLHSIFFTCWTRKEAMAKALGGGLACGLRALEVCCSDHQSAENRVSLQDQQGQEWCVQNLPLELGWSGAVAVAGKDWHWRIGRWT